MPWRGAKADELHQLAEVIRFRYGLALPPSEEARSLIKVGRVIWDGRDRLIQPLATRDETPPNDRIRRDLLDIIVLWADLGAQLAPADSSQPRPSKRPFGSSRRRRPSSATARRWNVTEDIRRGVGNRRDPRP